MRKSRRIFYENLKEKLQENYFIFFLQEWTLNDSKLQYVHF